MSNDFATLFARPNQPLSQHLNNVSILATEFAMKCGMAEILLTAGFFHDLGKVSNEFQVKLQNETDERIPHSIYGAKKVYENLRIAPPIADMLANIIAMHHGRLHDYISPSGDTPLIDELENTQLLPDFPDAPEADATLLWKTFQKR